MVTLDIPEADIIGGLVVCRGYANAIIQRDRRMASFPESGPPATGNSIVPGKTGQNASDFRTERQRPAPRLVE